MGENNLVSFVNDLIDDWEDSDDSNSNSNILLTERILQSLL